MKDCINKSIANYGDFHHNHCPHCNGTKFKLGAGLKPREQSIHCQDCGKFIAFTPLGRLESLKRRKRLTACFELLEKQGIQGEQLQLFILNEVNAGGGES